MLGFKLTLRRFQLADNGPAYLRMRVIKDSLKLVITSFIVSLIVYFVFAQVASGNPSAVPPLGNPEIPGTLNVAGDLLLDGKLNVGGEFDFRGIREWRILPGSVTSFEGSQRDFAVCEGYPNDCGIDFSTADTCKDYFGPTFAASQYEIGEETLGIVGSGYTHPLFYLCYDNRNLACTDVAGPYRRVIDGVDYSLFVVRDQFCLGETAFWYTIFQ